MNETFNERYITLKCKSEEFHHRLIYVITACKWSLGQGKIFTGMCQSFRPQGEGSLYDVTSCLTAWSYVPSWGLCLWPHFPPGVSPWQRPPPLDRDLLDSDPLDRVLLDRDPQTETPWTVAISYGKEWVVRILLECILVSNRLGQYKFWFNINFATFKVWYFSFDTIFVEEYVN